MQEDIKHISAKGGSTSGGKEGDHVPETVFKIRTGDKPVCGNNSGNWLDVTSNEIFSGKKVIVFALPGAFTPTCSSTHLPGYNAKCEELNKLGVDEIYCLSVNDSFVMNKWALELDCSKINMLPDGNGDFTREMGMMVKKRNLGFGERSWRYSMLVENGIIKKLFSERGFSDDYTEDPFEVSDVDTMLTYLEEGANS